LGEEVTPTDIPRIGRVVRHGKVVCTVISNAELMQHDPSAIGKDIIACGHADDTGVNIEVFTNGAESFECGTSIDPATGCALHLDICHIPVPVCL